MKISIFYSWQSDLPSNTNRYFIEQSIKLSLKEINKDNRIVAYIDRDTKDELGSPDIRNSIFQKINHCRFFICDVSLNDNKAPNSNVLIELGYAIKVLGWSRIICLFNTQTGNIEELPFDINHNRVTAYSPKAEKEKNRIANIISTNFKSLIKNGELYNPIQDHIKKKIDYIILQIAHNIINFFDFESEINYSKQLAELDDLSEADMAHMLSDAKTLGFYYLFDYEEFQLRLESILNQLLSCNYFYDGWREAVINFIDWIDIWKNTIDPHYSPNLLQIINDSNYAIKDMHEENFQNPFNSVLLLKQINGSQYSTIQGGFLTKSNYSCARKIVCINEKYGLIITKRVMEFLSNLNFWMEESGNEIILDPHYFIIN